MAVTPATRNPFCRPSPNQLRVIVRSFAGGIPWTLSAEGKSPHRIIVMRGIKWKELPKAITCTPQVADKSGSLWLTPDGNLVHPDAPKGGGGPGSFRLAGAAPPALSQGHLPHPLSPAARERSIR